MTNPTTPPVEARTVEMVARDLILRASHCGEMVKKRLCGWDGIYCKACSQRADAILRALRDAGLVVKERGDFRNMLVHAWLNGRRSVGAGRVTYRVHSSTEDKAMAYADYLLSFPPHPCQ